MTTATTPKPPPPMMKWMLNLQVSLLRLNLIKRFNKALMVITTTGRKSGKKFSRPIGYVRDGNDILTFSLISDGRRSNWYENVLANQTATLEVQGQKLEVRGTPITDPAELPHVIEVYKTQAAMIFERFFGISPDAPIETQLEVIPKNARFMRFTSVK